MIMSEEQEQMSEVVETAAEQLEEQAVENGEQVEQPVEEAKAAEPEVDLSAHFAEIKRREREIRAERNKIKEQIESEKARLAEELKANPIAKLQELGITTEALASGLLDMPEAPSAEEVTKKELEELKAWKMAQEQAKQEAEQQKLVEDYQKEVLSVVESDTEKFELINNHRDGKDLYWNSVVEYYRQYGEAPDHKEIAERVENHLYEESKKLLGLSKLSKLQKAALAETAPQAEGTPVETKAPAEAKKPSKTLTNNMSAQATPTVKMVENAHSYGVTSPYSQFMEERKAKLLAKLEGK